ncbi:MAG: metallophosphoesterase family protein [Paracoccaceae bacterium]|nr:metallophosphoesterase family protein [Paracoccaceae bacterium]
MTGAIFVVGDIHGQLEMLESALAVIDSDPAAGAPVVFVGDYLDRGPDSKGVVARLMQGQAEGRPWICLMGNHDRYLLRFLQDPAYRDPRTSAGLDWLSPRIGGRQTLASYGVDAHPERALKDIHTDALAAIPQAHVDWIANLPLCHETDAHIFAHAGIRPGVPLEDQEEDDLLWIRGTFLDDPRDHGRLVVHGHTAIECPQHYGNRLNMDGGAGYGRPLDPAVLLGREAFLIGPRGRVRL